jgi:large subunit ribosomal protein L30
MIAVIRIRGRVNRRKEINDVLDIIGLKKPNTCILMEDSPETKKMLQNVKDFVSFGKIDKGTLVKMLKKRGRIEGNRRLDEESVKETGYKSVEELAEDIYGKKVKMKDVPKLKKVFRLSPPSKGFKSTKRDYPRGDLGNRKETIKELVERMI